MKNEGGEEGWQQRKQGRASHMSPNISTVGKPEFAWRLEQGQSTDGTGELGHAVCSAQEYGFHPACSQGGQWIEEHKHYQSRDWVAGGCTGRQQERKMENQ